MQFFEKYLVEDKKASANTLSSSLHVIARGGIFFPCALLREFGLPDTHIVWAILALGYPAHEGRLLARWQNVVKWVEPRPLS